MKKIEIRELTVDDQEAFLEYVHVCQNDYTKFGVFARHRYENFNTDDFESFVEGLREEATFPKDKDSSRQISYFAFEGQRILGSVRCRLDIEKENLVEFGGHIGYDVSEYARGNKIGQKLCKFALHKYSSLNINNILIVIDEDNYASRHIVEKLGGELENIITEPVEKVKLARYWIKL